MATRQRGHEVNGVQFRLAFHRENFTLNADSLPPMNCATPPPSRHRQRWQVWGLVILLAGVSAAGWIWWQGRASAAGQDDPAMLGFDRASHRQMALFYGKSGYLIDDLWHALKQPHTCAIIVLAASVLLAGGCLSLSRLPELPTEPDFFKPSEPARNAGDRK